VYKEKDISYQQFAVGQAILEQLHRPGFVKYFTDFVSGFIWICKAFRELNPLC